MSIKKRAVAPYSIKSGSLLQPLLSELICSADFYSGRPVQQGPDISGFFKREELFLAFVPAGHIRKAPSAFREEELRF